MRFYRRPFAWALLLALLFVQMATAYACATENNASADSARLATNVSSDCEGMQMPIGERASPSSPLCVDHCTHATDATADSHLPPLYWLPVLVLGLTIVTPSLSDADQLLAWSASPGMARSVEPPIPILLGRFLS